MIPEPTSSSPASPDRLFSQATKCMLVFGFVCVVVSHLILQLTSAASTSAQDTALESSARARTAWSMAATLESLTDGSDANAINQIRTRLVADVGKLRTPQARDGAENPGQRSTDVKLASRIDALAVRIEVWFNSPQPNRSEASALKETLLTEIIPPLDLKAARDRLLAKEKRLSGTIVLGSSLLLHLVAGAALVLLVLRPFRKAIATWVNASKEIDRDNRFRLLHNTLTGMPNQAYLHAYLSRVVAASDRKATQTAVLRIDFDRFRVMRDTLGVRVCDEVIRIASRRILQVLRAGDFAAYIGQDDFVVVTGELVDANAVAAIASRIQASIMKPFVVRGGARKLSCSIGVTLLSDDAADPDLILSNAEIALLEAQAEGQGMVRYFNKSQRDEVERRETLYEDLTYALENGDIIAYFQPQIDLQTGKFAGFEALVRWDHPDQGLLNPASFLEFAYQSDLTERLGEVVLTRTMEAIQAWDQAGFIVPKVGVNFALAQLSNPRLIEKIKWDAERHDVEPDRLAIEVLETVLIKSDADMVVRNLKGLASAGFGVELDDFGTGHASISNLRRFMVNRIKIDKSFVLGIETNEEQQQLTRSMIAMAQALGIETLAEGVETEAAELMLKSLGCNYCQGYFIARPMALEDTGPWLESYMTRPYASGDSQSV